MAFAIINLNFLTKIYIKILNTDGKRNTLHRFLNEVKTILFHKIF